MPLYVGHAVYQPLGSNEGIPVNFFYDTDKGRAAMMVVGPGSRDEAIADFIQRLVTEDPTKYKEVNIPNDKKELFFESLHGQQLFLTLARYVT